MVSGSRGRLARAVGNLLDNAVKWSPPGQPVEVAVAAGEVTVRDHGPGIAEEDLPHVFDRFYRAPAARGLPGSGLGLAIVKHVADAHGGSIVAEAARRAAARGCAWRCPSHRLPKSLSGSGQVGRASCPPMTRSPLLLAAVGAALALGACGSSDDGGSRPAARTARTRPSKAP